jgi:hypothetical protein
MKQLRRAIDFPRDIRPILITTIHTEEEFDWSKPFDRANTAVTHLGELERSHEIFVSRGVSVTYLIDYPIASEGTAIRALKTVLDGENAVIGAHLHPWVNPPFVETVSNYNSYPGNLPAAVERAKLHALTARIQESFDQRPTVYLAGRYGFGERSLSMLQQLGYRVDLSGVANGDFRGDGGPDFRSWDSNCFWEGSPPILRIPHSSADVGLLCRRARRLIDVDQSAAMCRLRLPGILARLGGVRRIRLTPEGFSLRDLMVCARALITAGIRVLVFSFHSPSLAPGFTPYVRDLHDRSEFLARIDGFLKFFREEFGGQFGVPDTVYAAASAVQDIGRTA